MRTRRAHSVRRADAKPEHIAPLPRVFHLSEIAQSTAPDGRAPDGVLVVLVVLVLLHPVAVVRMARPVLPIPPPQSRDGDAEPGAAGAAILLC